ncbi:MAG: hypothetical protein HYX92_10105 [Chloroflexi bacterium]|nr:hypothetical protein [Chloroflexota bacterium]
MGDIGSAFDKAMERVAKLEKPSEEELARWKYVPEGERLAVQYLKGEGNLAADVSRYDDKVKRYVLEGAVDILLRNLDLPRNEFLKNAGKKAMEGLKVLKRDKTRLENVFTQVRRVFTHYEQDGERQRKDAYAQLRQNFQSMLQQAMRQQGGMAPGGRTDVESHPQFQEEWRRTLASLDASYLKLLEEYKEEIVKIP